MYRAEFLNCTKNRTHAHAVTTHPQNHTSMRALFTIDRNREGNKRYHGMLHFRVLSKKQVGDLIEALDHGEMIQSIKEDVGGG